MPSGRKPRSRPAAATSLIEVTIESLAFGGDGVAHAPRAVFVPDAAPGDRLRVRIVEDHPHWSRAEIVETITRSPFRRDPPCPYASRCGGCSWQHVVEETQAEAKRRAVEDALRRIGGLNDLTVPPVIAPRPALRYRRHQFQSWALGSMLYRELGLQYPDRNPRYELAGLWILRRIA